MSVKIDQCSISFNQYIEIFELVNDCRKGKKCDQQALENCTQYLNHIVLKTQWTKRKQTRLFIQQTISILKTSAAQLTTTISIFKIDSLFQAILSHTENKQGLKLLAPPTPPTALFTLRLRNQTNLEKIRQITLGWFKKAEVNFEVSATAAIQATTQETTILSDSMFILDFLTASIPRIDDDFHAVYIAYTGNREIQGVAIANTKHAPNGDIWHLATHPDNLDIIKKNKKRIKGVGTALITHIACDILKKASKEEEASLTVTSLKSAKNFYKKLGFSKQKSGDYLLFQEGLGSLVNKKRAHHTIQQEEREQPGFE